MNATEGVLRIDKPEGPTSHDVVAMTRRALRTRRIGHTGTLDPFASGLLLLCLGRATRIAEYLTGLPKTYLASIRLGVSTDTDDRTGEIVRRSDASRDPSELDVRRALEAQTGTLRQLPPVYSAKKVGGERMYAAARRGEELERTPVEVTVHRLELLSYEPPDLRVEVECSSGTYIRAIARDVGEALGVGGHLTELRRTAVGSHRVEDAIPVERLDDEHAVRAALLPPAEALDHLPRLTISAQDAKRISHGGAIAAPEGAPSGGVVALVSDGGELLAIAERRALELRPRKVLA